jgi:hypothetical protein
MYSAQGMFQHHFQCKKVHTLLDKIQYYNFLIPQQKAVVLSILRLFVKFECQIIANIRIYLLMSQDFKNC